MLTGPLAVVLCLGMKESTKLNTVFTLLNVGVILFVLIGGAFHINGSNWSITTVDTCFFSFTDGRHLLVEPM